MISYLSQWSDRCDVFHQWINQVSPLCIRTVHHLPLWCSGSSEKHLHPPVVPVTDTCWKLWLSLYVRLSRWSGCCSLNMVLILDPNRLLLVRYSWCHIYRAEWRPHLLDHQPSCCWIHWLKTERQTESTTLSGLLAAKICCFIQTTETVSYDIKSMCSQAYRKLKSRVPVRRTTSKLLTVFMINIKLTAEPFPGLSVSLCLDRPVKKKLPTEVWTSWQEVTPLNKNSISLICSNDWQWAHVQM